MYRRKSVREGGEGETKTNEGMKSTMCYYIRREYDYSERHRACVQWRLIDAVPSIQHFYILSTKDVAPEVGPNIISEVCNIAGV